MKYLYSIIIDTKNAAIEAQTLKGEIEQSSISKELDYILTNGDEIEVNFKASLLTAEETTLTAILGAHEGIQPTEEIIPSEVKIVQNIENPPFSSKVLNNGQKLYRRKHGVLGTIDANSNNQLQIIVPYPQCKINKIELTNCKIGDTCDLKIYDNSVGTIQQIMGIPVESITPNLLLNQFGFNVCLPDGFYVDESNYDADLIQGMIVEIDYNNNSNADLQIGLNVTLHEMV